MQRLITILAALLATSVLVALPAAANAPHHEAEFLQLINAERAAVGLAPLTPHWDLADDAIAHSLTMAGSENLHHNPALAEVTDGWHALGENVGVGPAVAPLHEAFMNSPGHRDNVLGNYNFVGIGVEDEGHRMWVTVVFMRAPDEHLEPAPAAVDPVTRDDAELAEDATNLGLVDPATGIWYLRSSDGAVRDFYFGNPGDYPMLGDWDCDGVETPGLYRQSDGYVYLRNSNTQGVADIRFYFGNPGDVPVAGDFNGDGCDSVSVYRPSTSTVYIINRLGSDELGLGAADYEIAGGGPGKSVIAGDWDGDGIDTVVEASFGSVAGDWDGNGAEGTATWTDAGFDLATDAGADFGGVAFGSPGLLPISGWAGLG